MALKKSDKLSSMDRGESYSAQKPLMFAVHQEIIELGETWRREREKWGGGDWGMGDLGRVRRNGGRWGEGRMGGGGGRDNW